jgi:uncharacterized protein with FMN-binding domain
MSKKGKIALIVGICVGAVVFMLAVAAGIYAWRFTSATRKITIEDVDFAKVPDGEYPGRFSVFHVSAEVTVTVRDGEIARITLVRGDANRKQMQAVIDRVMDRQSLEVDTVSGATVSTKAVLKAIENALTGGGQ